MPDGYTMRKLRKAMEVINELRQQVDRGDEGSRRLLERLGERRSLPEIAKENAELEDHEVEYLNAFPPRLLEGVRAVLNDAALEDSPPMVEIQFLPGYDFEVRLSEYGDQLTISLRGPFAAPFPRDSYRAGKRNA